MRKLTIKLIIAFVAAVTSLLSLYGILKLGVWLLTVTKFDDTLSESLIFVAFMLAYLTFLVKVGQNVLRIYDKIDQQQ